MEFTGESRLGELVGLLREGNCGGKIAGPDLEALCALGYKISHDAESSRITQETELVVPWELARGLQTKRLGRRAEYHDEIGSTQNRGVELARASNADGTVIIAGTQTRGRGRHARKWESPAGGVWMSVVLGSCKGTVSLLPLAASLALADAIISETGTEVVPVWPNDIVTMRDGVAHKVAGIVIDAEADGGSLERVVLGAGINFGLDEGQLNASIDNPTRPAASLRHGARAATRTVQAFLLNLERICARLESSNVAKEWAQRSGMLGRTITLRAGSGERFGTVARIDPDGALVLSFGGAEERFVSGEVSCVR